MFPTSLEQSDLATWVLAPTWLHWAGLSCGVPLAQEARSPGCHSPRCSLWSQPPPALVHLNSPAWPWGLLILLPGLSGKSIYSLIQTES